jgi:hypothetical protein
MTKQTQASPEEKPSPELLLRRFKLMDEFVENLKQQNIKAGIDPKVMKGFVPWSDFVIRKISYQGWIDACTNPRKPGKFYTISDLKKAEKIPEDFISEHEEKKYPYRKLDSLYKIKSKDGKLWLMRYESWYGLDSAGEEKNISVNDLDYWVKPNVRYEYIPKDPENPNGLSIRVGIINDNKRLDPLGERVYLTPYSLEKVDEYLRYGSINKEEPKAGTTLILQKEDGHSTTVSYDEFIADDFDNTFKRINTAAPTFKDFYKDLTSMADKETAKKEDPYG